MKKYRVIYKAVLMENLQYAANTAMGFISYFMLIFVFIHLWNYMYAAPDELIAGYTKEQMIWYVMITEMIWFGARSATIREQVSADIRGGNIAYLINKPYRYPLYILAKYTGEWNIQLLMYAGLTIIIGVTMVGEIPDFHWITIAAVVPCIALGMTIHAAFKLCIGMLSFWIEDANPFQWLYDKLILVVGIIFPVEIFPAALQPMLKLTPIYTVCYGPAKLIVDFSLEKYLEILLAQIVYLAVGGVILFWIYERGGRKLYVNGG